jgi:cysteine desulfurase
LEEPLSAGEQFYLDYAATTPLDPAVLAVMLPYFQDKFGNPSSVHRFGQIAEAGLENAREMFARDLNAQPGEVVFTGCGTESDNLALRGAMRAARLNMGKNHLLITPVEHHAVLHTAEDLQKFEGFELEFLKVDQYGRVDPQDVKRAIRPSTGLVSVIYANNEIGTINPIAEIGKICHEAGVLFHTDAVQAAAYIKMDVQADGVDLLSLGGHKFHGPKGVGALYVRKGSKLVGVQTGGSQENGLRAGTQNVPYIVGMAEAFRRAQISTLTRKERYIPMRDFLIGNVLEAIPDSQLTGHPTERLPNHASFVFRDVDGNRLLTMLDLAGFACSSGSACKTGSPKPSEVLQAIGLSAAWALGSLRVTMGESTGEVMLRQFLEILPDLVERQRSLRS